LVLAATPGSLAPGVFDPGRSLDLLMMAVIGGLGSPVGAILGVGIVQTAYHLLPDSWKLLATGSGVLLVVMFRPGGLSGLPVWIRDAAIRILLPRARRDTASGDEKAAA
jgi:branched-chain amino acid transport system permease protein